MIFRNFYGSRKIEDLIRKFSLTSRANNPKNAETACQAFSIAAWSISPLRGTIINSPPQEARLSRKSAYTARLFSSNRHPDGALDRADHGAPDQQRPPKNIFYRTAQAAVERSPERRGQMTDLSDAVLPHFSAMTPSEISRQIAELNERIRRRNPNRARFDPEAIVARIEAGEQLFFALDEADLKALFGSTAPFRDQDVVFVTLRKQADGPLVEVVSTTLVNKKVHP
jgi:hypothetical protein